MSVTAASSDYDYLRRKGSSRINTAPESPRRKAVPASVDNRGSHGTISSTMTRSTDRESATTNITEPPAYSKKFVVVGDGGCGKTCLLISYSQGYFPEKYVPTVFENYITHTPHPPTGKMVELALWDTAGQEEYDRLRPLSYPETDLLFVCFAIDCPNSLENVLDKWYPEVLHFCPTTPVILIGLKSDLRHKRNCIELLRTQGLTPVSYEQGKQTAQKMGAYYMECSSKEMDGVEDIFDRAIEIAVGDGYKLQLQQQAAAAATNRKHNGRMGGAATAHSNVISSTTSAHATTLSGSNSAMAMAVPPKKKKNRSCKIL